MKTAELAVCRSLGPLFEAEYVFSVGLGGLLWGFFGFFLGGVGG